MANGDVESRLAVVEARLTILEEQAKGSKKVARRQKEYTDEERAATRARLLAGQVAARKRREDEAKVRDTAEAGATKKGKKTVKSEKPNVIESVVTSEAF